MGLLRFGRSLRAASKSRGRIGRLARAEKEDFGGEIGEDKICRLAAAFSRAVG